MRNTQKPFRHAIFTALSGNITYNTVVIPIGDEKKKQDESSRIYVIFGAQSEQTIEENDSCFITQSSIELWIVSKTFSEVSKDTINDISDSILELLLPTTQTNGFTTPSGMEIQNIKLESSRTQSLSLGSTESILSQTIVLTAQIVQQS